MQTMAIFTAHPVRRLSARFFTAARRLLPLVAACASLSLGCATTEHPYLAAQLPRELQATRWEAPCSVDLAAKGVDPGAPKFDSGDEVEVLVATSLNASDVTRLRATVARDGTVELPVVGKVSLAGVTSESAKAAVMQACHQQGVSQAPLVQISLVQPRQHRITVTGAVEHPGVYMLPRQSSSLVSALAAAGGLSREAGTTISIHSRKTTTEGGPAGTEVMAAFGPAPGSPIANPVQPAILNQGAGPPPVHREIHLTEGSPDLALQELADGDVVSVERRDPPSVVVTGMVHKPGRFDFPIGSDFRVLDAIASAQGTTYKMIDTVLVCRAVAGQNDRVMIQVSLREASRKQNENILLQPGDIITVESNLKVMLQDSFDFVGQVLLGAAPAVIKP
jgi:polysaccharide export outer membrane protein